MFIKIFLFVILYLSEINLSYSSKINHDKVVVCYIGTWSVYRPERGSFNLDNIEADLCTHLVYSFAGLDVEKSSIKALDEWQDLADNYGKNGYGRIVQIKKTHPKLKVTLAIGGWNEGSEKYSTLAADPEKRALFVKNTLAFILKYNFDGLDLDWEFPGKRGGKPEDKENFVLFVKELRTAFNKHSLLLTAAFGAGPDTIDVAYDVPQLSQYLDFIHMMCYDYHGTWDGKTGANAPLYSDDQLSVDYTIKYMLKLGAPRHKLVMGVPLYGRTFKLVNTEPKEEYELGDIAESTGFQGPFTRENGFMGYNEICLLLQNSTAGWKTFWDDKSQTAFAVNDGKMIAYDDVKSIKEKIRAAQKYRLAGAMVWSLDTDDFRGDCHNDDSSKPKGYPLMRAINEALALPPPDEDEDIETNEIPDEEDTKGGAVRNILRLDLISLYLLGFVIINYLQY